MKAVETVLSDRSLAAWVASVLAAASCLSATGCDPTSSVVNASYATPAATSSSGIDQLDCRDEPIGPLVATQDIFSDKVGLGRDIFHDKRLSKDNSISCASCHVIAEGGDDGLKTAVGIRGQVGAFNTPTVLNSSLGIAQLWDGRAKTLLDQAEGPIHNPTEMDSNWDEVIGKLQKDPDLVTRFHRAYGAGPTPASVMDCIVAYEEALITVDSPFDQYLRRSAELSSDALAGYETFKAVGCISCHQGQAVGGNMFQEFGVMKDFGEQFDKTVEANQGRIHATNRTVDLHRFKVPSLRNVALTGPYFHDGSVETLTEAIEIMADFQLGAPLDSDEVMQIRAFLESLTGEIPRHLK